MEDGGFDDPIEPEDPTDVNKKKLNKKNSYSNFIYRIIDL